MVDVLELLVVHVQIPVIVQLNMSESSLTC